MLIASMAMSAEAQQQDAQLNVYLVTTYGLEADNHCHIMDFAQREAVAHMKSAMKGALVQRYDHRSALEAEAKRFEGLAREAWMGCLSGTDDADKWKNVESAIFYGDALLAAPGGMPEAVTSCAVGQDGAVVARQTFTALRDHILAGYEGQARTDLETMSASMASAMASQCLVNRVIDNLKHHMV